VASLELAAQSGSAQLQALAAASTPDDPEQVLDGSASPLGLEQGQMSLMLQGGGAGGGGRGRGGGRRGGRGRARERGRGRATWGARGGAAPVRRSRPEPRGREALRGNP
jgi:hypothetical protein